MQEMFPVFGKLISILCLLAMSKVSFTSTSVKTILSSSSDIDFVNFSREDSFIIDEANKYVEEITLSKPSSRNSSTFFGFETMQITFLALKTFIAMEQLTKLSVSFGPKEINKSQFSMWASLKTWILKGSP